MKKTIIAVFAFMVGLSAYAAGEGSVSAEAGTTSQVPPITSKISGFVMGRYNYTTKENVASDNSFSLRIARIQVAGKILGDFDYRLQCQVNGTSGSISGPRIVDAYVEWQKYKPFYVKVGQFKRAFTFENPMNPIDQGFYGYSSAVDKLSGMNDRVGEHASNGRDLGVQFQGDLFNLGDHPLMHYQIGVYNGQGINMADANSQKDLIGGVWFIPVEGARIGVFGWDGRYSRSGVNVKRQRYAISGEYKFDDWQFRSEYIHSYGPAFLAKYGSSDVTLDPVLGNKADAWYAQVIAPIIDKTFHLKARYDVYRDNAQWDRCYTAYDFGADYMFTKNLTISAICAFVNDRRLPDDQHNYCTGDIQISFRF